LNWFAVDSAHSEFTAFDLLSTAVLLVDSRGRVSFANQAAEQIFEISRKHITGQKLTRLFVDQQAISRLLEDIRGNVHGEWRQVLELRRPLHEPLPVHVTASGTTRPEVAVTIEISEIDAQLKVTREEHKLDLSEANRQLLRNLAHEVKNPLGGIRGAAQLLDGELATAEQREYTRVIMDEADRLQALVDRLLEPHHQVRVVAQFNPHEVCERVRAIIQAEFPIGLQVVRDYDASVPEMRGDKEQLIQSLLNVARNAAQALEARIAAGDAEIVLRTRVARNVTIGRRAARLALDLHVIDNGPGIPEDLKDRIFYPLVSGREGGSGLGLTLAQTYVQQNNGTIECESRPGRTDFRILVPLL
jgi:two-component system nitrogen regulation sensor histidine kinase GlnL